jgi:multiple sugar transport system substrate-binding protein
LGATLGGAGLAISDNCKHRDIALDYAWWVAGQECQRTLFVDSGGQPASKTAWRDPHANELTNGYFAATLPVLETAWLRPRFAGFEAFQVDALTTVAEFLKGKMDGGETLSRLDDLYTNALANEEQRV